jgi:uncharacterized protein YegP (UPF0339 family)
MFDLKFTYTSTSSLRCVLLVALTATKETNNVPENTPKFIVFRDLEEGNYWWRLRSSSSETLAHSEAGYAKKEACQQDLQSLKASNYPDAEVLDLTIQRQAQ